MWLRIILIFSGVLMFYTPFAQTEATTADGRRVFLYPDGTWKAASVENIIVSPDPIIDLEIPKSSPDDEILRHTGYTLSYNQKYHMANWAAYRLIRRETDGRYDRTDRFVPDPLLKSGSASNADYHKSGYDRGHLAPAADMAWSEQTMTESFYLSNMSPQEPGFNRGIWKNLEGLVRSWVTDSVSLYIVTGTVLTPGLPVVGKNRITVPQLFYKVILEYQPAATRGIGFLLPNEASGEPLSRYAVTIDSVERVTGRDFFYRLPDQHELIIESTADTSQWRWNVTAASPGSDGGTAVQCLGVTKSGNRCQKMTSNQNGYCNAHQQQAGEVKER